MAEVPEKWAAQYGSKNGCFEIQILGVSYVVVCSQERAMEILKQRPYKVQRNVNIKEAADSGGALGVFSAEGPQWQMEKKLIAAVLNRSNVHDFLPSMMAITDKLMRKWQRDAGLIVISSDIGNMTADAISEAMLNKNFDFVNNPENEMARNVFKGFDGFNLRALSPIWYWRIPIIGQDLDGYGKYYRNIGMALNQVIDEFEKKREEAKATIKQSMGERKTFLGKLYDAMEKENSWLSRARVVGNIVTAFIAGIDTTSKTLNVVMYLLASNKKLQKELRDHVAHFDLANALFEDLCTCTSTPMLKSFLHEVHRCYGVPFLVLKTVEAIPFCGDTLSAHQEIMILSRYLSMQTENPPNDVPFGPDNLPPSAFSHRRYLVPAEESNEQGTKDENYQKWTCRNPNPRSTSFMSFGHGARVCPGRVYSEVLSYCFLIFTLQNFEFELAPNHPPVKIVFESVMATNCELQLKMTRLPKT